MWIRMMSSNVFSAVVKPSLSARSATKSRGQPEPDVFGDRQHRLRGRERLADDVGEEAGSRLVRLARPHADRRQADRDAVEQALASVVIDQEFADRLLCAVARQRRMEEFIADL